MKPQPGQHKMIHGGVYSMTSILGMVLLAMLFWGCSSGGGGDGKGETVASGLAAEDDAFRVVQDSQDNVLDVLANDSSGGAPAMAIRCYIPGNRGGAVSIDPSGSSLIYTPAPEFTGTETLGYFLTDGRDARLVVNAPESGTYFIIAWSSKRIESTGSYRLSLIDLDAPGGCGVLR